MKLVLTLIVLCGCAVGVSPTESAIEQHLFACDPDCDSAALSIAWGMSMDYMSMPWMARCYVEQHTTSNVATCLDLLDDGSGQACQIEYQPATGRTIGQGCASWGASE